MKPAPPADLSAASRKTWPGLAADVKAATEGAAVDYDLLADVLRARDRLTAVSAKLTEDGVIVAGSMGQVRPHPLLAVETNLRREVAQGLERLSLTPKARDRSLTVGRDGRLEDEYR